VRKVFELAVAAQDRFTVMATDGNSVLLASYLSDGRLNPAFSQDGRLSLSFPFVYPQDGTFESIEPAVAGPAAAVVPAGGVGQPPGPAIARIVIAADVESVPPLLGGFQLARYQPFDRLDPTFGPNAGFVRVNFLRGSRALSVRVDKEHRIVAAGSVSSLPFESGKTNFALFRYQPTGLIDATFDGDPGLSGNGQIVTIFQEGSSEAEAVTITGGQGQIVAAGQVAGASLSFALARYLRGGRLDTGFSGDGRVVTSFPEGDSGARAVVSDFRGRIVAAGFAGPRFALARYLNNGALDIGFGGDGRVTTTIPGSNQSSAQALVVGANDDTISVVGEASHEFAVARFRDDGVLDADFGGDGRVRTVIGSENETSAAQAVAIDSQGRLIVAGVVEQAVE
jgi:uncharacterized delta-60 repeat protein